MGAKGAKNPATGLTTKQSDWCFQTIRLGDPNKAYRVAYDNWTMSQPTVRSEVSKMLKKPEIAARLSELQEIADSKLEVSIERIAKELARIGFASIRDLYDDLGNPIPIHLLPDDVARAVQSVTVVERKGGMAIHLAKPEDKDAKKKDRAEKAEAREKGKADDESVNSIEYVAMREKKVTMHPKQPALETMAKWKRMIVERVENVDPNDPRALTDAELEEQIRANQAALAVIDKARGRSKPKVLAAPKAG